MLPARRKLVLGAMLLAFAATATARRVVPPTIELDGCVLPATACGPTKDVVEMVVGDQTRRFGVEALRVTTVAGGTSKLLTELRLHPLRVHGPGELTEKLVPGARRRVRGTLRLGPRYLLLQAVEPLADRP